MKKFRESGPGFGFVTQSRSLTKLWRMTKLTLLLIFLGIGQALAISSYAQSTTLNLNFKNATLEEVLAEIEDQSEFFFLYNKDLIDVEQKVDVEVQNKKINEILDQLLEGKDIRYFLFDRQIVLSNQYGETGVAGHGTLTMQQQRTVSGTVTDESGEPLPGVTVVVQGTTKGAITNADGEYSLSDIPDDATLQFSFVGMKTQEISVGNQTEINVSMVSAAIGIEEVVAIGYGTARRSDVDGAISSAKGEDLELDVAPSMDMAMQGKLSGVNVFSGSHKPGGGISVKIRGSASISAAGSPLYVIDGMPIGDTQGGNTGGSRSDNNPLMTLSPSNIESIEVLKGASSTAIYGSRGASGVVLITTRKGRAGEQNIDFNSNISFGHLAKKLDFLNAEEHAILLNEMKELKGESPLFSDSEIANMGEGTDWQDALFRTAMTQNHELTFSGGSQNIQYLVSGDMRDEEGIMLNSGLTRYSGMVNLNAKITDRLSISENFKISYTNQNEAITGSKGYGTQTNSMVELFSTSPTMPVYNENGDYMKGYMHRTGGVGLDNPVRAAEEYMLDHEMRDIIGNIQVTYNLFEGLDAQIRFGIDQSSQFDGTYYPSDLVRSRPRDGVAEVDESESLGILSENLLQYSNTFEGVHNLNVTAGYTYERQTQSWTGGSAWNFPSDYFKYNNLGAAQDIGNSSHGTSDWTLMSYLGRAMYSFNNTYSLTLSVRADGSSKFGINSKWGYFPAAAIGWRLSDYSFIENIDAISNLKLRASYGKSGNDRIGSYASLALIEFSTDYAYSGSSATDQNTTAYPGSVPNPDLGWEVSTDYDFGFDLSMFNNRLTLYMDYYYQKTSKMILGVPLPRQSGYSSSDQNIGQMENKGIELNLTSYNISNSNFTWETILNFSANRNEILSLGADESNYISVGWLGSGNAWWHGRNAARLQAGHPVGAFYGSIMHENTVWKDQAEIDQVGTMPEAKPGDYRFVDRDGNGTYNPDDNTFIGDPNPDFIYGLTNTMNIGNINIRLFLQGTYGNDILFLQKNTLAGGTNLWRSDRENRWTADNPRSGPNVTGSANSGPRYGHDVFKPMGKQGYPNVVNTDQIYDGSFLRVKNLKIGYTIPQSVLGIRRAQIYVSGTNLLTFTKYPGYDPEVNAATGSNIIKGVDRFTYPASRTFTLGVNLGF